MKLLKLINVPYMQKFSPGENFCQFHQCLSLAKFFFPRNFCSVKTTHYFLPRAQAGGKIKFGEIFVPIQSIRAFGEIFLLRNFCRIWYCDCGDAHLIDVTPISLAVHIKM